ncbi:hypothetical protein pb186bvf_014974 [Paramecium bursaria]
MNLFINSIYEAKGDVKIELVDLLGQDIQTQKGIVISDLSRLFIMIKCLLMESSQQLLISTHQLINILQDNLLKEEVESGMKIIQDGLIKNLADTDWNVRKSTKNVFIKFVQKTRNIEQVLQILSVSLQNKDFYIRERVINLVPDILQVEKSIFQNRSGINDVRRIIESLLIQTNDTNLSIKEEAIKSIRQIKQYENFDIVYRRLATEHQLIVDRIQNEIPKKIDKFIQLNLDLIKDAKFEIQEKDFVPFDFLTKACFNLNDFPYDLKSKLYFGFLQENILIDTLNKDLAVREKGIIELNNQFFIDNEEEISINSSIIQNIAQGGFMPSFFKYISSLFTSDDFRIINILLNILSKIIQIPGIHVNVYLPLCLPGLIQALKDDRVVIRQRSIFLLKQLIKYMKKRQYLLNLIYFLDQKSDKWHQKEELLNMISYLVLSIEPTEEWFYSQDNASIIKQQQMIKPSFNIKEVDFQKILRSISFHLDDRVSKVKTAALECLAIFSYNDHKHLEYLHEILDQGIYEKLNDKIDQGLIYFINDQGNLELPQFNVKKMQEMRISFKEKESLILSQRIPSPPQVEEESQESADSNYKITYFYDKFHLSQREKIHKSNQSLDNLFASEHNNIDNTKYDLIVPINQIQQTNSQEAFKMINSNLYVLKQQDDEIMPSSDESSEEMLEQVEFQYPTRTLKHRGHPPEQLTQSKFQPITDVRDRVNKAIKQLNEDVNVDMQIPKVVKANVTAYQGYQYDGQVEDDEEIFIDTKALKEEYKNQKQQEQIQEEIQQAQNDDQIQVENVLNIMKNEQLKYTPEQRYQKRLEEFMLTFENREIKGKNARKIKKKLLEQSKQELPNIFKFNVRIENPSAEMHSLLINLSVLDVKLLQECLFKLQILLTQHIDSVYSSQASLLQIINDVCRLLSTNSDNPLYSIDYSKYPYDPQMIVRVIVVNAMKTISIAVQALRKVLIHVQKMFRDVGIWLQDENKIVSAQAEETLLDIIRYCDDTQLSDIFPKLYNKQSFSSKIYVGVLIENLVLKYQQNIQKSPHFKQILQLISQMIVDISFDVRRQGKKVFFKILNYGQYQAEEIVQEMPQLEKEQMRSLIQKHKELLQDNQIGEFDPMEYLDQQAVPFKSEYFEVEDYYM